MKKLAQFFDDISSIRFLLQKIYENIKGFYDIRFVNKNRGRTYNLERGKDYY